MGISRLFGAKLFIAVLALTAVGCSVLAFRDWHSSDPVKFLCYLGVALLASSLKIKLPGVNGTMSVNFLFILLGVLELSFAETLIIGFASVFAQCYWRSSNLKPIHVVFNLSQLPVGTAIAYGVYRLATAHLPARNAPMALLLVAIAYFAFNTLVMSFIIWLTESKPLLKVWSECYFWSFPYYLVGAAIAGLAGFLNRQAGWQSLLLVLPPVYLIYRSYRLYLGKLEDEKRHAEQVSHLHLKTIEALALAIEAKDHTTHDHLQRVRVYAMELAKDLGLSEDETEALRAASVLHDIGKLAVPEHIISKPGKLTPEEFEKMKIHPVIGAEILEQVDFPYPVVPIVRAHHEKWDGSGYPNGLKGEEIPIGARILAAVDCLDALASDRQYRRGLPLEEAMARVAAEAGRSFDPRVVEILGRCYVELEKLAHESFTKTPLKLSKDLKVERGISPAAGFEQSQKAGEASALQPDDLPSPAVAWEEAQALADISRSLGAALRLPDLFSLISGRLKRLAPHDALAIYFKHNDLLTPEYVEGENFRLFSSLKIPVGEGLSGWVAQNNKPIVNGNPSVEPGYLNDPTKYSTLRSALAVPLEGPSGVMAVLALYRAQPDGFTKDHLRSLRTMGWKLGLVIENALRQSSREGAVNSDPVDGLPNARSLFLHLEREIAHFERSNKGVGVFLAQLDGLRANGRPGQAEEDRFRRTLAAALKQFCRQQDCVARTGNDEFAVIVSALQPDDASHAMQRLRTVVSQAAASVGGAAIRTSCGYACYPADGATPEDLLAIAARRLCETENPALAKATRAGQ